MAVQAGMPGAGPVERLVRHDRLIVAVAVGLIVLGSASYTVLGVGMNMSALEMTRMAGPVGEPMQMGAAASWSPSYAVLIFFMWWFMMIAMMSPSAAPMLLLFAALKRHGPEADKARLFSLLFLAGYLVVWAGFSAAMVSVQWSLEQSGLVASAMMAIDSRVFAGLLLLAAGLYQFTALKTACLAQCRSPAGFMAEHGRPGAFGALRTGVRHGWFCLGCCWALMALLFVGGIMNLYWIVGLALFVLVEKLVSNGRVISRVAGFGLIAGAALVLGFPHG